MKDGNLAKLETEPLIPNYLSDTLSWKISIINIHVRSNLMNTTNVKNMHLHRDSNPGP